jgi:hypothetical protein
LVYGSYLSICVGASWTFAINTALEGAYRIRTRELLLLSVQDLVDCGALDLGCVWVGDAWTTYQWIQENRQIATEADSPYMSSTYSGPPGWLFTAPSEFPLAFYALLVMFKVVMLLVTF